MSSFFARPALPHGAAHRGSSVGLRPARLGRAQRPLPPLRLLPGRSYALGGQIGKVFVEGHLSDGPEAIVFAVRGPLGAALVLKQYDLAHTPKETVLRAVAMQRRCRGPECIAVTGFSMDGSQAYCLMERITGPSVASHALKLRRSKNRLPLSLVLQQFAHMAQAAAHCHGRGVIHRDLTLDNFVLSPAHGLRPKLTDFTLAHPIDQGHYPGAGTLTAMAPELLRGSKASQASDVYALGIALFTLIVGIEPHYHDDEAQIALNILTQTPSFSFDDLRLVLMSQGARGALAAAIVALYCALTQKNPNARPSASMAATQATRLAVLMDN